MPLNGSYWFGVLSCCKDKYLGNLKENWKGKLRSHLIFGKKFKQALYSFSGLMVQ